MCLLFGWAAMTLITAQERVEGLQKIVGGLNENIRQEKDHSEALSARIEGLEAGAENLKLRFDKVVHQKKSSEVRLGLVAENSLGFISDLPYNFQNMRHLGAPVDYIYFNFDNPEGLEVVIIEVKSGKSRESKKQKLIKLAISLGRFRYEKVCLGQEGVTIIKG